MKQTKIIMGMPVSVEILDKTVSQKDLNQVFDYFVYIDQKFSTYKKDSEITAINEGRIKPAKFSQDMRTVFKLSEQTKQETKGYFDICHNGLIDPSGLVKGWAIWNAAKILKNLGFANFYIDAGGDIQVSGSNKLGKKWRIGIRNPFNTKEIIKALFIKDLGVATSGVYIRGMHIYNPHSGEKADDIVSLTVIGPNIYEADRFATAAFAMGQKGIEFIEELPGFEGYVIGKSGTATFTSHFNQLTRP